MNTAFTPGPWSLHCYTPLGGLTVSCDKSADRSAFVGHKVAFGAGEILLGEVTAHKTLNGSNMGYPRVSDFGENLANAHLIAAAPTLYDALECLTLVVGLTAIKHAGQLDALQQAVDMGRTALKAARGEA